MSLNQRKLKSYKIETCFGSRWRHDIIDSCLVGPPSNRLPIRSIGEESRFIIMGAIIDTLEKKDRQQRLKCHHHYMSLFLSRHKTWHESRLKRVGAGTRLYHNKKGLISYQRCQIFEKNSNFCSSKIIFGC